MSARADAFAAVVAAVNGLTLTGTPAVATWDGERAAFNEGATHPAVFVSYDGATLGEPLSIGSNYHQRELLFSLYVAATNVTQALEILEEIEEGATGDLGATVYQLQITGDETLEAAELGAYLYRQRYSVAAPFTG